MTTTPQDPAPDAADRPILDDRAEADAIKGQADAEPAEQD